jgi:hypothetical protein
LRSIQLLHTACSLAGAKSPKMDGIPCEHGRLDFDLTIKNGDVTGGKWCCYVLFLECMGLSKMD